MESKHTPGPWHLEAGPIIGDETEIPGDWVCVCDDEAGEAGSVVSYCHPDNATIIAAAPELLAALIDVEAIANGTAFDCKKERTEDAYNYNLGMIIGATRKAIRQAKGSN